MLVRFLHVDAYLAESLIQGIDVEVRTFCKTPDRYLKGIDNTVIRVSTEGAFPASFVLIDGGEMIVLLERMANQSNGCGFCTNSGAMVSVFRYLYEQAK